MLDIQAMTVFFSYLRNKSVWTVVVFLELTNFSNLYYRQIVK